MGDYIEFSSDNKITNILPRKNILSKTSSMASLHSKIKEQYIATNVDDILIMIAANQRFTIGKLQRYLETFSVFGINPKILLSKADFREGVIRIMDLINKAYPNLDVIQVSTYYPNSIKKVKSVFKPKSTIAALGASGVGKSTLLNTLVNEKISKTGCVRKGDKKGRHTTTNVSLYALPFGNAYYIDTPGFKSIDTTQTTSRPIVFDDIFKIAKNCKFRNCRHITEPNCAVKDALNSGKITQDQYSNFLKYESRVRSSKNNNFFH